jgi:hypothetical protein
MIESDTALAIERRIREEPADSKGLPMTPKQEADVFGPSRRYKELTAGEQRACKERGECPALGFPLLPVR